MIEDGTRNSKRFHYPVALDVSGRLCVVVGGGAVGIRKAAGLLEAGATVAIVAPELCSEGTSLVTGGSIQHHPERFVAGHLDGAFLAVSATDNPQVNRAVAAAASERGILLNQAAGGDGDDGDFATMATVRRGDLLIGVTTGGAGPALSARLRRELAERFGVEWETVVAVLSEMRHLARETISEASDRTTVLRELAAQSERWAALVSSGNQEMVRQEAQACLNR